MKSRRTVAVLSVVASVVWGSVIWQIAASSQSKTGEAVRSGTGRPAEDKGDDSLRTDYPDPFLKPRLERKGKEVGRDRLPAYFLPESPSTVTAPPGLFFRGCLVRGKQKYVLLESAGKRLILCVGEVRDGLRVVRAEGDSVVLWENKKRYVLKK